MNTEWDHNEWVHNPDLPLLVHSAPSYSVDLHPCYLGPRSVPRTHPWSPARTRLPWSDHHRLRISCLHPIHIKNYKLVFTQNQVHYFVILLVTLYLLMKLKLIYFIVIHRTPCHAVVERIFLKVSLSVVYYTAYSITLLVTLRSLNKF